MKCMVCGINSQKASFRKCGIVIHRFPNDRTEIISWLTAIGKPENTLVANGDGVCSNHFLDSDYRCLPLPNSNQRPLLKKNAIPTLQPIPPRIFNDNADGASANPIFNASHISIDTINYASTSSETDLAENLTTDIDIAEHFTTEIDIDIVEHLTIDESQDWEGNLLASTPKTDIPLARPSSSLDHTYSRDSDSGGSRPSSRLNKNIFHQETHISHKKVQVQVNSKTKATETSRIKTRDIGVQCGLGTRTSTPVNLSPEFSMEVEEAVVEDVPDPDDPTFDPDMTAASSIDMSFCSEKAENIGAQSPNEEKKYIVFESCLLLLFHVCFQCQQSVIKLDKIVCGTALTIKTKCVNGHNCVWDSQPRLGKTFWGNIILASVLFYMGNLPHKFISTMKKAGIEIFVDRTYFYYQRIFVSITQKIWRKEQTLLLEDYKSSEVAICGDGRADSPGHTAKYGTYTFMDGDRRKILHFELVQSTEVKNSFAMELEGLKRGLLYLVESGIKMKCLITDRHVSIQKFMRENYTEINHYFDNWHVAKGIQKKLIALSKQEKCEIVAPWIPSIVNHVYWCAATIKIPGKITDKWTSLVNHIANQHQNHKGSYKKCAHGALLDHDERVWIAKNSEVHSKLSALVKSPLTLKSIEKLSPKWQTSSVEAFHSVLLSKCPKRLHFFYDSMLGRTILAILHYNENGAKDQDLTNLNEPQWKVVYSKAKKGKPVAKPVLAQSTYNYIDKLLEETVTTFSTATTIASLIPPSLSPGTLSQKHSEGVVKTDIIEQHKSRFAK